MYKKMVILGLSVLLAVGMTACSGKMSQAQVEKTLEQYMQDVYAPASMKQFKEAKVDSAKLFTQDVTDRFFVAYSDQLSEADKKRVCETYIYHGAAENQKDGKERYLIEAYLYTIKGSDPIRKNFTFIMNASGKVEDFTITDPS